MSNSAPETAALHLNLLLFSVGGLCFGVDVEQIETMARYDGEVGADLHWFHKVLGFAEKEISYLLPTVLSIRTGSGESYRVIIDKMEDIAEYGCNAILPFPLLLEPYALRQGMWGVLPRAGQMVLLVDFQRMAGGEIL